VRVQAVGYSTSVTAELCPHIAPAGAGGKDKEEFLDLNADGDNGLTKESDIM
jgi:hypothetical protein